MASRGKWSVDFTEGRKHRRSDELASPPGYIHKLPTNEESTEDEDSNLVAKQGWGLALGPLKQLPMNLFIMWMAGNTVSLFPIMMVGMMFFRPVQTLLSCKEAFKNLVGDQAIFQKAVYVFGNLAVIALAVYKFHSMGLLPTYQSDWLEFQEPQKILEISGGGIALNNDYS
ncbi:PREDICTED: ER membrane protein complex subunit 4-like [Amphimedon queenslandica]|uniref:ER membrane protein complex subunit 4 n=1 Tax=Amphimedon queenslandica TaxID=400682 RepID=A0A1X7V4V3_AMPQE|nr:PREDICTED: ER membrane protein complex subunit 4-like [Amphimedon queenslandica]|eukprot:XP_003385718.1 PREDICTED: ER membrane protein complex subunit 4-like [Amphimedon queenslandica]